MDYKELRRLAEAATPGPWSACGHRRGGCTCGQVWSTAVDFPVATAFKSDPEVGAAPAGRPQANALYIAAASPSVVLALLEEIEGLKKDAERLVALADFERTVAVGPWSIQVIDQRGGFHHAYFAAPPSGEPPLKHPSRLDALRAAIDAAMSPQEKEEG